MVRAHLPLVDQSTRNATAMRYRKLAFKVANLALRRWPWIRRYLEEEDVEQEAFCGVLHAAELHDPEHESGAGFIRYASKAAERSVLRAARWARLVHIPEHMQRGKCVGFPRTVTMPDFWEPAAPPEREPVDRELVERMLTSLRPCDQELVTVYFGLHGKLPLVGDELAARFGLLRTTVTMRLRRALAELRGRFAEKS